MTSLHAFCCLPSVKKQEHHLPYFFLVQCIIKQLLNLVIEGGKGGGYHASSCISLLNHPSRRVFFSQSHAM